MRPVFLEGTVASGRSDVVDCANERCGARHARRAAASTLDRIRYRSGNRRIASRFSGVYDSAGALSFLSNAIKDILAPVTLLPPPRIPWQITGNHWVALPCIHPADASIHAIGMLHRDGVDGRSEEHTSELQSLRHLVCRLLLEKKKQKK